METLIALLFFRGFRSIRHGGAGVLEHAAGGLEVALPGTHGGGAGSLPGGFHRADGGLVQIPVGDAAASRRRGACGGFCAGV